MLAAPCGVANPRDSYGYRCGLRLAWHADRGTGERVQLRFLGLTDWPIPGLDEVIVIKKGQIVQVCSSNAANASKNRITDKYLVCLAPFAQGLLRREPQMRRLSELGGRAPGLLAEEAPKVGIVHIPEQSGDLFDAEG